jgi:sugar lactone lactonase YvrE
MLCLLIIVCFRNFIVLVFSAEDSGRVLKFDPRTGQTQVLARGIRLPNGLSLSKDQSFFVFTESVTGR